MGWTNVQISVKNCFTGSQFEIKRPPANAMPAIAMPIGFVIKARLRLLTPAIIMGMIRDAKEVTTVFALFNLAIKPDPKALLAFNEETPILFDISITDWPALIEDVFAACPISLKVWIFTFPKLITFDIGMPILSRAEIASLVNFLYSETVFFTFSKIARPSVAIFL